MINQSQRKITIGVIIILTGIIYVTRLFYLQVIDISYTISADNNSQRHSTQYPARGVVFDRKGKKIVVNQPVYDLMIIPNQLKPFDTLDLANTLKISIDEFRKGILVAKKYSFFRPSIFIRQMSTAEYAVLQEKLFKFPGFYVQSRTLRNYPMNSSAHVLGYIGEVDEKTTMSNQYYTTGDYIGISGIEKSYEEELRGRKGVQIFLVDVHGRVKDHYKGGRFDTLAIPGKNIWVTLDGDLQTYGEQLMTKKSGSIVAIEPSTGEILALVSSPGYDPNLLVGRVRTNNYISLQKDTLKPLFNRALMAKYPPGSTFKLLNGLIALQEGIISPFTSYNCSMGYHAGGLTVGCHKHPTPLDLIGSVQHSCNAYYCNVFRAIIDAKKYGSVSNAYQIWRNHVCSFGLGSKLGSDLSSELKGFIPNTSYYDKYFGKNRWRSLTIISLSIGQGELGITPLQMANFTASIANRGYYITPHIIKAIEKNKGINPDFTKKHYTTIDPKHFEVIIDGMEMAVQAGTATRARIDSIIVCGKTGTAQNPHGEDHSIFIAFAPKHNPKIAIAVYIENAGFGGTWAAPIASLMIEKYLTGTIQDTIKQQRVIEFNLITK
jgi:penicillin-binding protein 2